MEDGYVKFKLEWEKSALDADISELNLWRGKLYDMGLIGVYPDGIGYGNISQRIGLSDEFIITGTGTGRLKALGKNDYTIVKSYDLKTNQVRCTGPVKASSESMTHAAIYSADKKIRAVIHVHSKILWERLKRDLPHTSEGVSYGTPAMAFEMIGLLQDPAIRKKGIIIMLGHEEGIVSFGENMDAAGNIILAKQKKLIINPTDP